MENEINHMPEFISLCPQFHGSSLIKMPEDFRINGTTKKLRILKFGGSSIRDAECIRRVARIVCDRLSYKPLLVLSAMGSTTNQILLLGNAAAKGETGLSNEILYYHLGVAQDLGIEERVIRDIHTLTDQLDSLLLGIKLLQELSARVTDLIMSFGERLAVIIFAAYLNKLGYPALAINSWDIGMITTEGNGSSEVLKTNVELLPSSYEHIKKSFLRLEEEYLYIPVITGFIAKDVTGNVTTLGRSGSDLSATLIGAAVGASEVEIWTDVHGILTADPRVVKSAQTIRTISFDQAAELSAFGANVIHPRALQPAITFNVPVSVRNSFFPEHPGTQAVNSLSLHDEKMVTAITFQKNVVVVDVNSKRMLGVHGFLAKIFKTCDDLKISIDVVATSEVSVSLSLDQFTDKTKLALLEAELQNIAVVKCHKNKTLVSIIGSPTRTNEIIQKTCVALDSINTKIQLVTYGASKVNLTILINDEEATRSVNAIHTAFFPTSPDDKRNKLMKCSIKPSMPVENHEPKWSSFVKLHWFISDSEVVKKRFV